MVWWPSIPADQARSVTSEVLKGLPGQLCTGVRNRDESTGGRTNRLTVQSTPRSPTDLVRSVVGLVRGDQHASCRAMDHRLRTARVDRNTKSRRLHPTAHGSLRTAGIGCQKSLRVVRDPLRDGGFAAPPSHPVLLSRTPLSLRPPRLRGNRFRILRLPRPSLLMPMSGRRCSPAIPLPGDARVRFR